MKVFGKLRAGIESSFFAKKKLSKKEGEELLGGIKKS